MGNGQQNKFFKDVASPPFNGRFNEVRKFLPKSITSFAVLPRSKLQKIIICQINRVSIPNWRIPSLIVRKEWNWEMLLQKYNEIFFRFNNDRGFQYLSNWSEKKFEDEKMYLEMRDSPFQSYSYWESESKLPLHL